MKPQDAKPQEANLRLTDKCEEQTRGQWDSEAEFLLGEELRQSPCGEKDPDVQGSTESKDQCGGIWTEKIGMGAIWMEHHGSCQDDFTFS